MNCISIISACRQSAREIKRIKFTKKAMGIIKQHPASALTFRNASNVFTDLDNALIRDLLLLMPFGIILPEDEQKIFWDISQKQEIAVNGSQKHLVDYTKQCFNRLKDKLTEACKKQSENISSEDTNCEASEREVKKFFRFIYFQIGKQKTSLLSELRENIPEIYSPDFSWDSFHAEFKKAFDKVIF